MLNHIYVFIFVVGLDPISRSLNIVAWKNLQNEVEILINENPHSCLMKLKGFCFQKVVAVVYDETSTKYLSDVLHSGI